MHVASLGACLVDIVPSCQKTPTAATYVNVEVVANRLHHFVRFDRFGIWTIDFPLKTQVRNHYTREFKCCVAYYFWVLS